jgi:hypothetical protein
MGRHKESGRAEAALKRMLILKRLLKRMKLAPLGKSLNSQDLGPIRLNGEKQA